MIAAVGVGSSGRERVFAGRRAVVPASMVSDGPNFGLSAGHVANGLLFVSGQLGIDEDGSFPEEPGEQARIALQRLGIVLEAAGCTYADVVELKTFHVGRLPEVNSWFLELKAPLFGEPYPAWTQVEVASLALPEARIEIAAVALVADHQANSV